MEAEENGGVWICFLGGVFLSSYGNVHDGERSLVKMRSLEMFSNAIQCHWNEQVPDSHNVWEGLPLS